MQAFCSGTYGRSRAAFMVCDIIECHAAMQVLLQPSREVLAKRVAARAAEGTHFMPASLLDSQLALMELDPAAYRYGERLQDPCQQKAIHIV